MVSVDVFVVAAVVLAIGLAIVKNMLSLYNNILEDYVVHSTLFCVQQTRETNSHTR